MSRFAVFLPLLLACSSCGGSSATAPSSADPEPVLSTASAQPVREGGTQAAPPPGEGQAVAIFAGGCFWCMEGPFEELEGVFSVLSGYAGGPEIGPTYDEVSAHRTGHTEAIRVLYDPAVVTYERLLEVFWHNIDPTDGGGQFCDRGDQYRTAIFPQNDAERSAAEASKSAIASQLGQPIATRLEETDHFWIAEAYHQDFHRTNPSRYTRYRVGCGRDARLQELWGSSAGH
ncbi:MAG: peptide-methionine (S)-S-oxide reductase MsrA [Myxococcota bacterium]